MSEQDFRSIPLEPQYEETSDHFEDVAWFLAEYDGASDIYERLSWVEKTIGRLDPSEVESIRHGLKSDLERYSMIARCVKTAYHPLIYTHNGYVEDPSRTYIPVPRQITARFPAREWVMKKTRRQRYFSSGDSNLGEYVYDVNEENKQQVFEILCDATLFWSKDLRDIGFLKTYEGKDWEYKYYEVHLDTLYFGYSGFSGFKAEFEQALGHFLDEAVRLIRVRILEPKGIKLRHRVEAKEVGKKNG